MGAQPARDFIRSVFPIGTLDPISGLVQLTFLSVYKCQNLTGTFGCGETTSLRSDWPICRYARTAGGAQPITGAQSPEHGFYWSVRTRILWGHNQHVISLAGSRDTGSFGKPPPITIARSSFHDVYWSVSFRICTEISRLSRDWWTQVNFNRLRI